MKTYSATPTDIQHDWYVVDADGMVLGRLATEVARIIRGKHKPMYTPHMDTGDNVIVINASKVRITGRKGEQKRYFHHTGYMGHERFTPFAQMLEKHPERVIEKAVYGMLPKTALGRQSLRRKLRVFATDKHSHAAQQPKVLDLNKNCSLFHCLARSDVNGLHDSRSGGAQLILHFHRFHDDETLAGLHLITNGNAHPHDQPRHRRDHRSRPGRLR
jgi:large subunit ribosomal protein L13